MSESKIMAWHETGRGGPYTSEKFNEIERAMAAVPLPQSDQDRYQWTARMLRMMVDVFGIAPASDSKCMCGCPAEGHVIMQPERRWGVGPCCQCPCLEYKRITIDVLYARKAERERDDLRSRNQAQKEEIERHQASDRLPEAIRITTPGGSEVTPDPRDAVLREVAEIVSIMFPWRSGLRTALASWPHFTDAVKQKP